MRTIAIVCFALAACDDDAGGPIDAGVDLSAVADMATGPTAARGEYLVKHLLACGDCHTTPDPTGQPSVAPADFLAGGRDFNLGPLGHVYAKNLTPDNTDGLGMWTLDQIKRAIKNGIDDQMKPLFPIMPYYMFHNLTDDDATSIAMYLKSLPPQPRKVPDSTAMVPQPAPAIDAAQIPHTTLASSDPAFASAERGRYLVSVSCVECHTKHLPPGQATVLDQAKWFAGGETFALAPGFTTISTNITPDATGLAGWSVTDIVGTLKTDQERGSGHMLCPPMIGGPERLGGLSDADLSDIANYVHTLPPVHNGPFGCDDGGVPYGAPDGG